MLLINDIVFLSESKSKASVLIDQETPFVQNGKGVPAWIGLEYMGQTAALIAGFQQRKGKTTPHLGFLLGSRKYHSNVAYFGFGTRLLVSCEEAALVGESLATFNCTIAGVDDQTKLLATAMLSVFRKPMVD